MSVMVSKGYSKTSWLVATGSYDLYTTSWYACPYMVCMYIRIATCICGATNKQQAFTHIQLCIASPSPRDMYGINLGAGLLDASLPLSRWPHQQLFLLVLGALSLAVVDDVHAQLLDTDAQHVTCHINGILFAPIRACRYLGLTEIKAYPAVFGRR